ncbi:MAG: hypothetical protein M0Z69_06895 [Actinomycetota bacterium]|nr:hypothetical protein [Actinomycetota bacterium]MDA8038879.1 hypothetical protein [Actinomycetota bacterium]
MPRHWSDKSSARRSPRPERTGSPGRKRPTGFVDEQALSLREGGASYSAIARGLELQRATDAHNAFIRALCKREGDQRHQLVTRESARLDDLELRIRQRDAADPEKVARRLLAVGKLREALP